MPCGTKLVSYDVSGSIAHAPPSEPSALADIDSTATSQYQVLPAGADFLCGGVHSFEAGRAEPVELHSGGGVGQASRESGGTCYHRTLIADR